MCGKMTDFIFEIKCSLNWNLVVEENRQNVVLDLFAIVTIQSEFQRGFLRILYKRMMYASLRVILLVAFAVLAPAFHTSSRATLRPLSRRYQETSVESEKYVEVPGQFIIRPSITDRARTITHVCTSGTLCTTSIMDEVQGSPFGSYVDYILDENGWPVMLLSEQSLHTANIKQNPQVSLFAQLPRSQSAQATAALSRVTVMGTVEAVPVDQLSPIRLAFTLVHQYADQIADSPKFAFFRIKPTKIYFSGGFGVMATWVDVADYESARPDVLAQEVTNMLSRINTEKQGELYLLVKHFLDLPDADVVRIQAIDRLGVDLRVQSGDYTDEYRVAFRHSVNSAEDAKSEVMKLFQESWERENGFFFTEDLPPTTKYAEDILRTK